MEGDPVVDFHEGHWACPMKSLSPEGDFCKTHLNSAILSNASLPSSFIQQLEGVNHRPHFADRFLQVKVI